MPEMVASDATVKLARVADWVAKRISGGVRFRVAMSSRGVEDDVAISLLEAEDCYAEFTLSEVEVLAMTAEREAVCSLRSANAAEIVAICCFKPKISLLGSAVVAEGDASREPDESILSSSPEILVDRAWIPNKATPAGSTVEICLGSLPT